MATGVYPRKPMTQSTKDKIRAKLIGNKNGIGNKATTGIAPWNKGLPVLEEHKRYLSAIQKGKHHSPETEIKKGQRKSIKTEFTIGKFAGQNHPNWKGGGYDYKVKTAPRPKPEICEICNKKGRICFDHDHKTGEFRGWICLQCNSALGMVKDSPEVLIELIKYLNRGKGK